MPTLARGSLILILPQRYSYPLSFTHKSQQTLETALRSCIAYQPWRELDPGPTAPLDARFDALPELSKEMIRSNFPLGLLPDGKDVRQGLQNEEIEYTFTSGTTGERVINIWDQNWWDRCELASWQLSAHLATLSYPPTVAKLASSLNVGISCEEDLPTSSRLIGNTLYLNEKINLIQWMPRHFQRMASELTEFAPDIIEANPSLLARLVYWAQDNGVKLYSPKAIIFTYEFISKIHLSAMRKAFSCPLISSYGTTETGFVLEECEAGMLHQNLDFCRIDFEPLKEQYGGAELGRMLVTTFDNPWNTVVRFDTGDLLRLYPSGKCLCGRDTGMIAYAVEGRISNCTFSTKGDLVTTMALDEALFSIGGIRDYHLEQNDPNHYSLQLMTQPAGGANCQVVRQKLCQLYGDDAEYNITVVDNILPGPAGKFRRTQVNFPFDWKELLA